MHPKWQPSKPPTSHHQNNHAFSLCCISIIVGYSESFKCFIKRVDTNNELVRDLAVVLISLTTLIQVQSDAAKKLLYWHQPVLVLLKLFALSVAD